MTWLQRYGLRWSFSNSLWFLPAMAIVMALLVAPAIREIEHKTQWRWFNLSQEGAGSILGAFTSSMLTMLIFVVSSLLIVVQLASASLTPRIIAMVFASRQIKWVLFLFTFSYTYTVAIAGRLDATTPQLPVAFAIACNLICIPIFFWFAQFLGGALRPISVLQLVAMKGRSVVESVYPLNFDPAEEQPGWSPAQSEDVTVVEYLGSSGVVLAFSLRDLVALAKRSDVVIELVPQVGDFLARNDPLFRIRNGGRSVDANALQSCVAVGAERTMEQDPRYAFRIMVDIANKALSPAINDPTTAVLALDQIHRLLMHVGLRRLDEGLARDAAGVVRLYYGTPDWIDFVSLGVTEIRHFGASSMQVARRLQAMLVHLLRVLPDARKAALLQELSLLERATQRLFPDEEDRIQARVSDMQGIGSSESA